MPQPVVAIQVGAISFADEGVEQVLDIFQERARVNALFLATQTFDRGTGGRQLRGHPLPDHGVQEYDDDFIGGNFATPHPEFYRGTILPPFRAPDEIHKGTDILEQVLPEATRRGMQVYCWINENPYASLPRYVPNFPKVLEVDVYGRKGRLPCLNNPDYRNWHLSLVEDYCKSYPIAGIAWASERQGPLGNLLGGGWNSRDIACFCEHCCARAERKGISVERARNGYRALADFFAACACDHRPPDGYFVTFWRLLLNYPEILGWEKLWNDGQQSLYAEIYGTVKAIDPQKRCGWHVMHLISSSPFYRAEQDFAEMARYADFLKVVMYHNCAGPRFARFVRTLHNSIFKDAPPEQSLDLLYSILGIREAPLADLPKAGFSADYVARETRRAVAATQNKVAIWPGIDIDIPTGADEKQTTPDDVRLAVKAALENGAQGVVLSRKYSEMRLDNLSGAGQALKELGWA